MSEARPSSAVAPAPGSGASREQLAPERPSTGERRGPREEATSGRERRPTPRAPEGMTPRLEHLERAMEAELGALRAGTEPLLDTLRQGALALEPGPGGTRPATKEREAWRARALQSLDVLEDVLEGLRLASRADAGGRRD